MTHPVIHLHIEAPAKPPLGEACNGCGMCCAWQPCPLGVLVTGRRHGACAALRWHDAERRYRCTMVDAHQHAQIGAEIALDGACVGILFSAALAARSAASILGRRNRQPLCLAHGKTALHNSNSQINWIWGRNQRPGMA